MKGPEAMFDKDAIDKALTKIRVTPEEENKKWVDEQLTTLHSGSVVSMLLSGLVVTVRVCVYLCCHRRTTC